MLEVLADVVLLVDVLDVVRLDVEVDVLTLVVVVLNDVVLVDALVVLDVVVVLVVLLVVVEAKVTSCPFPAIRNPADGVGIYVCPLTICEGIVKE